MGQSPKFRVFFAPIEIAGQMGNLAKGLSEAGHQAIGFNTYRTYLNYNSPVITTHLDEVMKHYHAHKQDYDIYHFFFNSSLTLDQSDLRELQAMGKKLVMRHWGNDVRLKAKAAAWSPYLWDPCNPMSDEDMTARLKAISTYVKTAIVQDFEVYPYIKDYYPNVHVLPLAVDVAGLMPYYPDRTKRKPLVLHAPTQPTFKGTATIEMVLDQLKTAGIEFDYRRIEKMSHGEAMALYRDADLVIDQILVGSHGTLAVESMALGKPVVSYIREDIAHTFPPSLPIVSASPANLYERLVPLLTDPELRYQTGVRGRRYAEDRHDIPKVISQLVDIYRTAP